MEILSGDAQTTISNMLIGNFVYLPNMFYIHHERKRGPAPLRRVDSNPPYISITLSNYGINYLRSSAMKIILGGLNRSNLSIQMKTGIDQGFVVLGQKAIVT